MTKLPDRLNRYTLIPGVFQVENSQSTGSSGSNRNRWPRHTWKGKSYHLKAGHRVTPCLSCAQKWGRRVSGRLMIRILVVCARIYTILELNGDIPTLRHRVG